MVRRRPIATIVLLILGVGGTVAALIWGNLLYSRTYPGGASFYIDWFSARSLFIDGINPYSENARNAMAAAAQLEGVKLDTAAHYASPLYAAFFTLPFAVIKDFPLARALWMALMEGLLIGLLFIGLSLARWRMRPGYLGLLGLFTIFWFHGLYPIITGNMAVLSSFFIACVFLAFRARQYEFAGVLLGLASIQPHAMLLFALFVVLWSFRNRQVKVAGWFVATVLLLGGASALIRPRWVMDYLSVIIKPDSAIPSISVVLQSFLPAAGKRLGFILSGLSGVVLFIEWFISKKGDFTGFYWTGLLTLALSAWIGLPTEPSVFLAAFPAIVYAYCLWLERWPRAGKVLVSAASLLLFAGIWGIYLSKAGTPASAIPGLFFALPVLVTIMLYWVRWWAIRKPNVWFDQLAGR